MEEKDTLAHLFAEAAMLVANEKKEEGEEASEISLEDQLAMRLSRIGINENEKKNTKLAFVHKSIELLKTIQQTLLKTEENESSDREYLGVRDLRLVHTMLQIIISWGLYPCFLPGVGVPLAKRVKSGYTSHELLAREQESEEEKKSYNMPRELFELTSQLVDMIAASYQAKKAFTTVGTILLTRHLPDLYAALLQLAYGPTVAGLTAQQEQPSTTSGVPLDPSQIFHHQQRRAPLALTRAERDKCARMFMWLFDRSDVQRSMESLMLLLGTSPLHPVPLWLRTICGRFLSRILLKPRGVATVLEFTVSDVEQVQLDQLEKVSKLVLSVPKQIPSVEEYYTVIAPQLVALLKESVLSPHARASTVQVVTFIIGKMIVSHTDLGIFKIVKPIMDPLVANWAKSTDDINDSHDDDSEVLAESELETLLRSLHQVMVGGEPSTVLIQSFLKGATSVLYYLYDYTVKSKSGLREMVLDILKTYFRIMDTSEAVGDLKRIVLSKRDLSGDRLAYFGPGPSGGVVMRMRRHPKPLAGNVLPLDPGVLVDFVAEVTTNQDLCGDFFVFLLSEYSGLQSLGSSTDPRLMLLILHLVTGMQEKLGPEILSKPAQIISFASNVITGYTDSIERLKHRQGASKTKSNKVDIKNIISEDDFIKQPTTEDVQEDFASLVMAINLLRAVIHGKFSENEELDGRTAQLLESTVNPLKQLETYRIEELEEPVHELLLMITSFLSVQKMERRKRNGPGNESREKYRDAMKALQDDLMPVRAHGMAILRDMVLARDPLVSTEDGLSNVLDIFVRLVQDEDSYIYLNAIKGLSALTDIHGNAIIQKLGIIYSDESQKLDNRLRVGEALLQTVQRSGDALSIYVDSLVKPLETVLNRREVSTHLRVSALSILSMACQTCPVALSSMLYTLTNWVLGILEIEKAPEIRRAATVLIISLFRGFASDALYQYPVENLKRTYRTLRYIEETDPDELTRHQARTALADLDVIMRREIFDKKEEGMIKIL